MKCIYKPIVKELLENAAYNKSVIAELILKELENENDMASKKIMNYFDVAIIEEGTTKYYQFTACQKDVTNDKFPDKDVPDVMWIPKYRENINMTLFIAKFQSVRDFRAQNEELCEKEIEYLQNILILPKLKVNINSNHNSFVKAYNESYYYYFRNDNSLHNSCMRYAEKAKACAQFYSYFAKCNILTVTDLNEKEVFGRAIVWNNVNFKNLKEQRTLLDRVYYCNTGILKLVYKYASENDFIRKETNSYNSKEDFMYFNKTTNNWVKFHDLCEYEISLQDLSKYKFGSPYLDTLTYGYINDKYNFVLKNKQYDKCLGVFTSTSGATTISQICPICGSPISEYEPKICDNCKPKFKSFYGILISKETKEVDGVKIPVEFLDENGNIKPYIKISEALNKLNKTRI